MSKAFINVINRISNLITVKTIVTLTLTVVFSILALRGVIAPDQILTIYSVIIAFYFGTQTRKDENKNIIDINTSSNIEDKAVG